MEPEAVTVCTVWYKLSLSIRVVVFSALMDCWCAVERVQVGSAKIPAVESSVVD